MFASLKIAVRPTSDNKITIYYIVLFVNISLQKNASGAEREAFRHGGSLTGGKAHGAAFFAALYDAQLFLALILGRRGERMLLILRGHALPYAFKIIKFHRLHR